ncbi:MAG: hypothetical protein ACRYG5_20110 [Janthinobacterium lividum]
MNFYSLRQLVALAKYTSPIYQQLYRQVEPDSALADLPILTHQALMAIVHAERPDGVFEAAAHGLIFESSASTGKPKVTLFGHDEWETSTRLLAAHLWRNGLLRDGDHLCNLCASPYLSYRLVHSVVERYPGPCSEIPIGCDAAFHALNDSIFKYAGNVLAAINSTVVGLACDLLSRAQVNRRVERILAGGELLYGAQRTLIRQAFPNAVLVSFMFGTTESGLIACSRLDDGPDVFRPLASAGIVEIVDEISGAPITSTRRAGKCVVTSLIRAAAPALRVDTGDYAEWLDGPMEPEPRFRLLGRKFPFTHTLRNAQFSETDVWALIRELEPYLPLTKLQLQIYPHRVEIAYALLDHAERFAGDGAQAKRRLADAVGWRLPMLAAADVPVLIVRRDLTYFLEDTRRKGRLIKDCR